MLTTLPTTLSTNQLTLHHVKKTYNPFSINSLSVKYKYLRPQPEETKIMLFSTTQLSRTHQLDDRSIQINTNGVELKRTNSSLLLGTVMEQNLKRNDDFNRKISSCYGTLLVLRKLKHLSPYHVRKQLAECLALSKIHYNEVVSGRIPIYFLKIYAARRCKHDASQADRAQSIQL